MGTTSILPVELIEFEILTRLPVKSLLRFKSVCKSWNLLFSSADFIKSVRNSSHDSFMLISMWKAIEVPTVNYHYWHCLEFTDIIGCIDGLVCFYNAYEDFMTIIFKIWNPATKQCLGIEPPPEAFNFVYYEFGFVFDSVANDYKIICAKLEEQQPLAGYIYSCNGGCWSEITPSNFFFHGGIYSVSRPFIFNGSAFWLITHTHDRKDRLMVISFDVREETFRLLPDPGQFESSSNSIYMLVKFRDSLAFFINTLFVGEEETIDIFTFNERCENWSKTSIGPFKFWKGEPNSEPQFLGCFNNSDILFLYPETITNKYYVNLQNYTIKSLGKDGDLSEGLWYGLTDYSESLVFIDGMKPSSGTEDEIRYYYLSKTN